MNIKMNIIEVKNVFRGFNTGSQRVEVLKDNNFTITQGTFNLLMGPSGSGKTTLLNILGTLDIPDKGKVFIESEEITSLSERKKDRLRKSKIGYIFQSVALISNMTAYENIDFFLRISGYNYKERRKRIEECLDFVGLRKRMKHKPIEMSGGEQQRVAIARAFSHKPAIILADEPTAELDTVTGLKVVQLFKDMVKKEGVTIVMCTHDRSIVELADNILEMEDGVILGGR